MSGPSSSQRQRVEAPASPPSIAWRRLDLVFEQESAVLFGGIVMILLAAATVYRTALIEPAIWGVAALAVTLIRLATGRAYRRREGRGTPESWTLDYCLGAWSFGILWGASTGILYLESDDVTRMLILMVQTGFMAIAAVRNSPVPAAMVGANIFTVGPAFILCLIEPNWRDFAPLILANLLIITFVAHRLGEQTLGLLRAEAENAALMEEIRNTNRRLETLAVTDALTGLTNRRGFDNALAREWRRAQRNAASLSLLFIDADYFKPYNDRAGHQAGDRALRAIADALRDISRRPGDLPARYGGEELALILPDTTEDGAASIAERLRAAIENLRIDHPSSPFRVLTVSIGCATRIPEPTPDSVEDSLVAAADRALYAAKSAGRNRVRS